MFTNCQVMNRLKALVRKLQQQARFANRCNKKYITTNKQSVHSYENGDYWFQYKIICSWSISVIKFTKQWQDSQCSNFQASAFSLYSAQHQWFNGGSLHYSYLCRDIIALQHYRPLQWYQISMPSHHSLSSSLTTIALLIFPLSTSVHTALAMVP